MIIPIIEVIQTYLFVSCFLKRKVRFGKVLDWLVLIGVSEVGPTEIITFRMRI